MRLFLDASCWFAAVYSPKGGSSRVLYQAHSHGDVVLVSKEVIAETIRNLREKAGPKYVGYFLNLYALMRPEVVEPSTGSIHLASEVIHAKDAHVLAAAKTGRADILVTLDRQHFLTDAVKKFVAPTKIALPKDLL